MMSRVLLGSPPHVRGKAAVIGSDKLSHKDHPRMCGEKPRAYLVMSMLWGSPPHVRGKVLPDRGRVLGVGITPAYAGKRRKAS